MLFPLIGVLIGAVLGMLSGDRDAVVGGALIGGLVGLVVRVVRGSGKNAVVAPTADAVLAQRVAMLEARVQGLERALMGVLR